MTPYPQAIELSRAVAAHGLAGSLVEFPDTPPADIIWSALLARCNSQRINGHLLQAVLDGALPATDTQIEQAHDAHLAAMTGVLRVEHTLLEVAEQLTSAGVDFRVLKGSGVARLDYPDPSLRQFCDVDLLVQSEQFDLAVATLVASGNIRRFAEPRPGFDRRFSKGTSFITPSKCEIDLHRTFVMGPFGLRVRLDDLWETSTAFDVGGVKMQALGNEERFLHACYHAALGDAEPRLVPQRDVAEMLLFGTLDISRVREVMARWKGDAVIARAVRTTWETLRLADAVALSTWALRYTPDDRDRKALEVYTSHHNNYAAKSFEALRAIPRLRDRAAFIRALTFPQRSYLQDRQRGVLARWRRAVGEVREGRAES